MVDRQNSHLFQLEKNLLSASQFVLDQTPVFHGASPGGRISFIRSPIKTQCAFTLIELMITLAVGIVILAIGLPSMMSMMSTNQAAGYANDLIGAIRLARSEAVRRGSSVTICSSNELHDGCSDRLWSYGWIVFSDKDSNYSYGGSDSGEEILRVWSIPKDEQKNLIFEEKGTPKAIRFNASGANASGAQIQFAFEKSDCHSKQARRITISRMGRPTLDHVACFEE